ncbi:MAG TPA: hypothetical protein VFS55_01960 [Dokdonella sp.]|nr:hypothetical protein [Dokdonella sp.]
MFDADAFRRGFACLLASFAPFATAQSSAWHTVVDNADSAPGSTTTFRSYNQPSINSNGVVVFRARSSSGSGGMQIDGVYVRDARAAGPIAKLAARDDTVPDPNNTLYTGLPTAFTEFPSIPRIDATSDLIATRGAHPPVWTYLLGEAETRVGTAGIYAFADGVPMTAESLLGAVTSPDKLTFLFPQFSVPGAPIGTRFDQFPGSPAVTSGRYIVFKGNYTDRSDGLGRTGVYYRDVAGTDRVSDTQLIANSNTTIPNQPPGGEVTFDSTAPPSAAAGYVYFTGLDNEDAPTLGGIYRARIPYPGAAPEVPVLEVMVGIGDQVPGEPAGEGFRSFGEALSLTDDGRRVAFWGWWGTDTFPRTLVCPTDGNPDLLAYCNELYPDGLVVDIPVHQGVFVHDALTGLTEPVTTTGQDGVEDYLFWVFSGRAPGTGGSEDPPEELARWRSSAFVAIAGLGNRDRSVAFKARRNGTQGIYLRDAATVQKALATVAEVGTTDGQSIDPLAPAGSFVSNVGLEREGFRQGQLAVTLSMLYVDPVDPEVTSSWGGIYVTTPTDLIFRDGFD